MQSNTPAKSAWNVWNNGQTKQSIASSLFSDQSEQDKTPPSSSAEHLRRISSGGPESSTSNRSESNNSPFSEGEESCKNGLKKKTTGPVHNQRYKAKMCKNWIKTGACPYFEKCQFAHGSYELEKWSTRRTRTQSQDDDEEDEEHKDFEEGDQVFHAKPDNQQEESEVESSFTAISPQPTTEDESAKRTNHIDEEDFLPNLCRSLEEFRYEDPAPKSTFETRTPSFSESLFFTSSTLPCLDSQVDPFNSFSTSTGQSYDLFSNGSFFESSALYPASSEPSEPILNSMATLPRCMGMTNLS